MPAETLCHEINGSPLTPEVIRHDPELHGRDFVIKELLDGTKTPHKFMVIHFQDENYWRIVMYPSTFDQQLFYDLFYQFDDRGIPVVSEERVT